MSMSGAAAWLSFAAGRIGLLFPILLACASVAYGREGYPSRPVSIVVPFPPGGVAVKIMMTAMMIHIPLAIAYGLAGAWLVHRFAWGAALMVGALFGLGIYLVNFYLIAPVAFPWFAMARNLISAFSHVMFGAVLGLCYVWLRKPK